MKKQFSFCLLLFMLITMHASFCFGMADHGTERYQFRLALELGSGWGPITFIKILPSLNVVAIDQHNQGIALRKGYKERLVFQLDDDISSIDDVAEQDDLLTILTPMGDFLFSWSGTRNHSTHKGKCASPQEIVSAAPLCVSWKKIQKDFEHLSFNETFLSYTPSVMLHNGAFCCFYDPKEEMVYTKKSLSPNMRRCEEILVGPCSSSDAKDRDFHAPASSVTKIPAIYSYTIFGQWLFCGHANGIISIWEDSKYCTQCGLGICEWSLHGELSQRLAS